MIQIHAANHHSAGREADTTLESRDSNSGPTMSDIDIHARHQMSHQDAQHAANDLAADLAEQFANKYRWDEDVINFERPGVDGQILVRNDEIRVTARLGFILMFLKPRIEQEVVRYLSEHFNCTFSS